MPIIRPAPRYRQSSAAASRIRAAAGELVFRVAQHGPPPRIPLIAGRPPEVAQAHRQWFAALRQRCIAQQHQLRQAAVKGRRYHQVEGLMTQLGEEEKRNAISGVIKDRLNLRGIDKRITLETILKYNSSELFVDHFRFAPVFIVNFIDSIKPLIEKINSEADSEPGATEAAIDDTWSLNTILNEGGFKAMDRENMTELIRIGNDLIQLEPQLLSGTPSDNDIKTATKLIYEMLDIAKNVSLVYIIADALNTAIAQTHDTKANQDAQVQALEAQLEQAKTKVSELQRQLDAATTAAAMPAPDMDAAATMDRMRQEIERLTQALEQKEKDNIEGADIGTSPEQPDYEGIQAERLAADVELEALEEQLRDLREKFQSLSDAERTLKTLQARIDELETQLRAKDVEIDTATKAIQAATKEARDMGVVADMADGLARTLTAENANLQAETVALQAEKDALQAEKDALQREKDNLQANFDIARARSNQAIEELQKSSETAYSEVARLGAELEAASQAQKAVQDRLKAMIDERDKTIADLQSLMAQKDGQIAALREENERLQRAAAEIRRSAVQMLSTGMVGRADIQIMPNARAAIRMQMGLPSDELALDREIGIRKAAMAAMGGGDGMLSPDPSRQEIPAMDDNPLYVEKLPGTGGTGTEAQRRAAMQRAVSAMRKKL